MSNASSRVSSLTTGATGWAQAMPPKANGVGATTFRERSSKVATQTPDPSRASLRPKSRACARPDPRYGNRSLRGLPRLRQPGPPPMASRVCGEPHAPCVADCGRRDVSALLRPRKRPRLPFGANLLCFRAAPRVRRGGRTPRAGQCLRASMLSLFMRPSLTGAPCTMTHMTHRTHFSIEPHGRAPVRAFSTTAIGAARVASLAK
jgi:hypothetical protein